MADNQPHAGLKRCLAVALIAALPLAGVVACEDTGGEEEMTQNEEGEQEGQQEEEQDRGY
ncbi:hypothetical protein [Salinactinospora qingdaonensis]